MEHWNSSEMEIEQERQAITKDIYKLQLILEAFKGIKVDATREDAEEIEQLIAFASIAEYAGDPNNQQFVLGLNNVLEKPLSYTAKKYVTDQLIAHFRQCAAAKVNSSHIDINEQLMTECVELQQQVADNYQKLAEMEAEMYTLIKKLAEIKLSPNHIKKIELLNAETNLNQNKATLLRSIMINQYCKRTLLTVQAIKEVQEHMKQELEKKN